MQHRNVSITIELSLDLHSALSEYAKERGLTAETFSARLIRDFHTGAIKRVGLVEEGDFGGTYNRTTNVGDKCNSDQHLQKNCV